MGRRSSPEQRSIDEFGRRQDDQHPKGPCEASDPACHSSRCRCMRNRAPHHHLHQAWSRERLTEAPVHRWWLRGTSTLNRKGPSWPMSMQMKTSTMLRSYDERAVPWVSSYVHSRIRLLMSVHRCRRRSLPK